LIAPHRQLEILLFLLKKYICPKIVFLEKFRRKKEEEEEEDGVFYTNSNTI
jgi:hypothetical protein